MAHSLPSAVESITSNPVQTRSDLLRLLKDLLTPLASGQSAGGARIRIGNTGTHFDNVAAELEGFARSLWGLAPVMSIEPEAQAFEGFRKTWVEGLKNGTNEKVEDEFWGHCTDRDQRFVEMAAIGFSLAMAPKVFWEPLSKDEKANLNKWLLEANDHDFPPNNWRFFRVLINLGLRSVGGEYSQRAIDDEVAFIDTFYGEHGFPSDGVNTDTKAYDYYATSFAIPFYSLIYAKLCDKTDPERAALYRKRAVVNLPMVVNLFAPDGGAIPFGRSMTYRFAVSCFFAAVAFDQLELPAPFTWGVVKGILLRNIRWFTQRPEVFNRDGSLSIGYTAPNMFMSEDYNSAQSPYWALKSFLVLSLPETHAFWAAKEEPYPIEFLSKPYKTIKPWMQVFTHAAGHTFCLSSGQMPRGTRTVFPMRQAAAKYGKLAYSSAFGFSVPTGALGLSQHAPDSALALLDDGDGERWLVRRNVEDVSISDKGVIKSTWRPWPDVQVVTWLIPPPTTGAGYHTRIHKLINTSSRNVTFADSGFAIHSQSGPTHSERRFPPISTVSPTTHGRLELPNAALGVSRAGVSGIVDLIGTGQGKVQDVDGNSNLIAVRSVIPMIVGDVGKGGTWIATRVYAIPATETGEIGTIGEKWVQGWKECVEGIGGFEGLKKKYGFINE